MTAALVIGGVVVGVVVGVTGGIYWMGYQMFKNF